MQANLENSAVATGLERVSFHSSPKEVKVKSLSRVRLLATLPGSSVHGIFQARVLESGAIAFSFSWRDKHKRVVTETLTKCVRATPRQNGDLG